MSIVLQKGDVAMRNKRLFRLTAIMILVIALVFAGCAGGEGTAGTVITDADTPMAGYISSHTVDKDGVNANETAAILPEAPAVHDLIMPEASGVLERKTNKAIIDYSNTEDGYVMVKYIYTGATKIKVQVKGPSTTYTYNLTPEVWTTFPLTDGNGTYQISVCRNIGGNRYAIDLTQSIKVALADEFAPFLRPNQYVNYENAPNTVAMAATLTKDVDTALEKVEVVYDYVVGNFTYDRELAQTVKSGYLPVLDNVLEAKKGICFDYAAVMTAMLRASDVPCKLVVGYAGTAYHAWISVWSEELGWIDGVIYFDGKSWQRMDPTFASSGGMSPEIMKYIGDGSNYTAKYFY